MDVSYTQNFDFWGDNTVEVANNGTELPGFYSYKTVDNLDPQIFQRSTFGVSTSNLGRFYNCGAPDAESNADERACVLALSSASGPLTAGLRFKNNTGTTITSLDVSFWGEQWRKGGATLIENTLEFEYLQAAVVDDISDGIDGGVYTIVPALNFVSPNLDPVDNKIAINGNLDGNRTFISGTITVNIPAGEEVMIRWIDRTDDAGFDHQMGMDDIVVTPRSTLMSSNDLLVRKPGVLVFPNPANEILSIDATGTAAKSLSVYDAAGRRVMSGNVSWGSDIGQLYVGKLPAGVYTLDIRSKDGRTFATKFIKK
jgi:hypothetical protein